MRLIESRGDGSGGDPEHRADRRVVEVGVVAEKDGGALPLRQPREGDAELGVLLGVAVRGERLLVVTTEGLRRTSVRATLRTMRHTQASSGPSFRNERRLRTAVAKASCTASSARSGSPVTLAATRMKTWKRVR